MHSLLEEQRERFDREDREREQRWREHDERLIRERAEHLKRLQEMNAGLPLRVIIAVLAGSALGGVVGYVLFFVKW